jgi:hypothetical protein
MAKLLGAKIGNFHTLTDWALYLKVGSPKISPPETDEYLVQVPGSDTLLNLTNALDGRPHYKKRTITMELLCTAPKKQWPTIYSNLANAIHGKWLQCKFDDDPGFYWEGLWSVDMSKDRLSSTVTITGTCNPFKRSVYDGSNDWLWDDFSFETDIVRNYTNIPLKAGEDKEVSITGAPRAAGIYFQRSETAADIAVSLNGFEVGILAKSTEWQYIEGLRMPDGVVGTLVFAASADCSVSIKYLGASL